MSWHAENYNETVEKINQRFRSEGALCGDMRKYQLNKDLVEFAFHTSFSSVAHHGETLERMRRDFDLLYDGWRITSNGYFYYEK